MAKVKKGDKFICAKCGLVVVVDKACGCAATAVLCCGKAMAQGKPAVAKAVKKAVPATAKPKAAVAAKAKAGTAKATIAAKKAPAKAVAAKPKAAAPKKAPAKK